MVERLHTPIAHKLLLILGGFFVVDSLSGSQLRAALGHNPEAVLNGEFWRLLTFPLISDNLHHLILTAFSLYAVFPELERMLGTRRLYTYGVLMLLVVGLLFTAMGQYPGAAMQPGVFPFVLAALVVFVYLFPTSEMSFFGIVSLPGWLAISLLGGSAVLVDLIEMVIDPGLFGGFLAIDLFGLGAGIAFAVSAFNNSAPTRSTRHEREETRQQAAREYGQTEEETEEDYSFAIRSLRRHERRAENLSQGIEEEETFSEERLNEILDKISSRGESSLSPDERRFLRDYAERL